MVEKFAVFDDVIQAGFCGFYGVFESVVSLGRGGGEFLYRLFDFG